MKTAKETLKKHTEGIYVLPAGKNMDALRTGILEAMHEYADQVKPKWISVDDQLPEEKTDVLVINKHAHLKTPIMIAFMMHDEFYSVLFPGRALTVTHWMPLPEKPE